LTVSRKTVERSLFGAGAALCLFYLGVSAYRSFTSRLAVQTFEAAKDTPKATAGKDVAVKLPSSAANLRLWGAKRIAAYRDSLAHQFSPAIAVLRAPTVGIEVPVFDGTDELVLNRGVGRITGTARPGEPGNIGIAGHRDGFFRALKDIAVGDSVTLDTGAHLTAYVVESIKVVTPANVTVLARTTIPSLTLVTCYPFYFVGDAPRRYIVRSVLKGRQDGGGALSAAAQ
jgi:sortase A